MVNGKGFLILAIVLFASLFAVSLVSGAPLFTSAIVDNGIDDFYYDGQTAFFNVSVVLDDSGVPSTGNLTINCSALGDSGAKLVVNASSLTGATTYVANCTINYTAVPTILKSGQFAPIYGGNITFVARNSSSDTNTSTLAGVIVAYNMTQPVASGSAMRFGTDTTDFSTVPDFSTVNFIIDAELNFTLLTGGVYNGTNAGLFNDAMRLNLASVNLSNSSQAALLANLYSALQINISTPRSFLPSRIYVNSSYFSALNTSGTITFYNLPFASAPVVLNDGGGNVAITSWDSNGYSSTYGVNFGNLTFSVGGFSGYNVTDNSVPIISSVTPSNGATVTSTSSTISVDVNGTGTEPSYIKVVIGGSIPDITYNATIGSTTNCTNLSLTREIIRCTYTGTLSDNTRYSINVSAWDYGGTVGNFAGSNNSFFVNTSSGGSNNPSSGGDNVAAQQNEQVWVVSYYPSSTLLSIGYLEDYGKNYRVMAKINGVYHYVGILSLTGTTATIQVASQIQEKTMNIGDEWKVDLNTTDNINLYSFYIKLNSISNSKANLTVKTINESYVPSAVPFSFTTFNATNNASSNASIGKTGESAEQEKENLKRNLWIWIGVVVVLVVIAYLIAFRKKIEKSIFVRTHKSNKRISIPLRK